MTTERRASIVACITLSAVALLWPALWNGYPLVFADTGTYLSQAIERHGGWDRPIFYSLFLFPLHMTLTTWPPIVAQALLTAHVLHLLRRTLLPEAPAWWLLPIVGVLTIATALPWFVSELMPDVFTGLLVLVLVLLIAVPERLTRYERVWLVALAAFMIATHLSHVLLACALVLALLPWRGRLRIVGIMPLALAVAALISVNVVAFGRVSLSPFGNVFLLTRVIYDGPGMHVLQRECPTKGWRLCPFIGQFPTNADDFLWRTDGPVARAGGAKLVSTDADGIIAAALRSEPGTELFAAIDNTLSQLGSFASGDGLKPWPATVGPVIERDFPHREFAAYTSARQSRAGLVVPGPLQALHAATALAGVAGCCVLLLTSRTDLRALAATVLLVLLVNALVTGALSGPHDRYQSRVMWLPPLVAMLGLASLRPAKR